MAVPDAEPPSESPPPSPSATATATARPDRFSRFKPFETFWHPRLDLRPIGPGSRRRLLVLLLAVTIGAIASVGAIAFREAIELVQWAGFGFGGEAVTTQAALLDWWHLLLVPTLGGLAIGLACHWLLPGGMPLGVPQVIQASALKGGAMSLRTGLAAAAINAASLGFGSSVGREGPVVHLGASMGAALARWFELGRPAARTLLGCGVASAVAASFNAPIAGSLFALEVVIGHYALSAFGPIVMAAVTGTIISRLYYGDFPAFAIPTSHITSIWEFPAFALLGVVSALAALVLMYGIEALRSLGNSLPGPRWIRPGLAGLVVGLMALSWPQMLGVGYEATDIALVGGYDLTTLLVLLLLKLAATSLCMAWGFGNGIFSPALFIGAMLGLSVGILAAQVTPIASTSDPGAYALVGMGAVAGAVLGAPISTILMIFELTGEYALTIAVMVGTVIANGITYEVYGKSFFYRTLERAGIDLRAGAESAALTQQSITTLMSPHPACIPRDASLAEIRAGLHRSGSCALFVVDRSHHLLGTISLPDLYAAEHPDLDGPPQPEEDSPEHPGPVAADICHRPSLILTAEDSIYDAVAALQVSGEQPVLPVLDKEGGRLVGSLLALEVMQVYADALLAARYEERGES